MKEKYENKVLKVLEEYPNPIPAQVVYGVLRTKQIEITFNDTKNILEKLVNDEEVIMFCDPEKNRNSPMRRTYSLKRN